MDNSTNKFNVYQMVTDMIIEKLEKGVVPWQKPWTDAGLPRNAISKRPYAGINLWVLASTGFSKNLFLTFQQVKELDASVKKGSKSTPVVFWKKDEKKDPETEETKKKYLLRYYSVFNVEQCEGLPKHLIELKEEKQEISPIKECELIVNSMQDAPEIAHRGSQAFYTPEVDIITMPVKKSFKDGKSYYGTLFHELVHSTGHQKRLSRKEIMEPVHFGTESYAIEELVAEMGACFLKSLTGIGQEMGNNAAYIQNWLERLKNDTRMVVFAGSRAQQAVDYILNTGEVSESDSRTELVESF